MNIEEQIKELESQLTGDMMQDMEIREKIHTLKMQSQDVAPGSCEIDCESCSG